jgi:hypothetical protein
MTSKPESPTTSVTTADCPQYDGGRNEQEDNLTSSSNRKRSLNTIATNTIAETSNTKVYPALSKFDNEMITELCNYHVSRTRTRIMAM